MGIFENKFDKKPLPSISFFEINLDFLPLQILQLGIIKQNINCNEH